MNLGLHILSPPVGSLATRSALQFADAASRKGHTVVRAFFSGDGVLNGTALRISASDEFDACSAWQDLHRRYGTELILCVSACHQRGILSMEDARRLGRDGGNLAPDFIIAGLGQLADMAGTLDRVVTFG